MSHTFKYDIGLVCWSSYNIGNNLTNYALYQYLTDCGYSVLMLGKMYLLDTKTVVNPKGLFLKTPYEEQMLLEQYQSVDNRNEVCEMFCLASDQVLRSPYMVDESDYHTCMDWVYSYKYKIAYAASFGIDTYEGNSAEKKRVQYLLRRFQKISVRERSGVDLLEREFNIKGDWVLDPIFLCNKTHYEDMAKNGTERIPKSPYVASYILDVSEEKNRVVQYFANAITEGKHLTILADDLMKEPDDCKVGFLAQAKVEEWLASILNCDFLITDSFHGMCFALIFEKNFCVVFNSDNSRGYTRFQSMLEMLGLDERIVTSYEEILVKKLVTSPIDYVKVNEILNGKQRDSKYWILSALEKRNDYNSYDTPYDIWRNRYENLAIQNRILKNTVKQIKRYLYPEYFLNKKWKMIAWGTGKCFQENFGRVNSIYELSYVCDNNSSYWGQMYGTITCVSPIDIIDMKDVFVVIMVRSDKVIREIENQLLEMGITEFEQVDEWLMGMEKSK